MGCLGDDHRRWRRLLAPSCRHRIRYLVSRFENASTEVTRTLPYQFLNVFPFANFKHLVQTRQPQRRTHRLSWVHHLEVDASGL